MRTEEQILNGELKEGTLGALNDAVTLVPKSVSGAVFFEIDSGLTGTVVFEATLDDTNWFAISALKLSDGSLITSVTSFADRGVLTSAGYTQVRLRVSAYTSDSSAARLNLVSVGNSPVWLKPTGEVTMANSQGVVIASDQTAIPITVASLPLPAGAATEATLAFIRTAVELLDNIVSGSEAQVDVITSALPAGGSTSANQTTEIADLNALNSLAGAVETIPTQITKTVASSTTPGALAADGTFFRKAILIGKRGARTNNSGTVYLGIGGTNDTQPVEISPGAVWSIEAPLGEKYDLNDWSLDVDISNDGVIVIYS